MDAVTMTTSEEVVLFDASNYPGFERAISLSKKSGIPAWLRFRGYGTVLLLVVVILWLALSGMLPDDPLYYVIILGALSLLPIAILVVMLWPGVSSRVPVLLTQKGMLLLGDRSWPATGISRVVLYGAFGAVELKDRWDHTIALIDRAQFGSIDDFLVALRRLQPDIKVDREYAPIKVRVPE